MISTAEIRKHVRAFMAHERYIKTARLIDFIGRWLAERDACHATLKQMIDAGVLNEKGGYVWTNDEAPESDKDAPSRWLSPADFADSYDLPEHYVFAAIDLGEIPLITIGGKRLVDTHEAEPWALCLRAELVRMGEL